LQAADAIVPSLAAVKADFQNGNIVLNVDSL